MKLKLMIEALIKYFAGLVLCSVLIFVPAGTIYYTGGIKFMCLLFIPMFIMGIVLIIKDPKLLAKRLKAKESERTQSTIIKLSGLLFLVGYIVAGLDFRYKWYVMPEYISNVACIVMLISYGLYAEVLRENR